MEKHHSLLLFVILIFGFIHVIFSQTTLELLQEKALSQSAVEGLYTLDFDGQYFYGVTITKGLLSPLKVELWKYDSTIAHVGRSLNILTCGCDSIVSQYSATTIWANSSVLLVQFSMATMSDSGSSITAIDIEKWHIISNISVPYTLNPDSFMVIPNGPINTIGIFGYDTITTNSVVYFYNYQSSKFTPVFNSTQFLGQAALIANPKNESSYGYLVASVFSSPVTQIYDLSSGNLVGTLPNIGQFGVVPSGVVLWVANGTVYYYDVASNSTTSEVDLTNYAKYNGQLAIYSSPSGTSYILVEIGFTVAVWLVQYDIASSTAKLIAMGSFPLDFNLLTLCSCAAVQSNLYAILQQGTHGIDFVVIGPKA